MIGFRKLTRIQNAGYTVAEVARMVDWKRTDFHGRIELGLFPKPSVEYGKSKYYTAEQVEEIEILAHAYRFPEAQKHN
jgi:hypothetical protein